MLKFNSLTNVRPTKDLGCQIIAAPTSGQFKVTPDAAKVLDVAEGDYVQLVEAGGSFYAVKGSKELGGGKLGAANKTGGGVLNFSGAKAWDDMGGDSDYNTMFELKNGEDDVVEQEGRTYYKLEANGREEKQSRKSSKSEDSQEGNANLTQEAPVAESTNFDDI